MYTTKMYKTFFGVQMGPLPSWFNLLQNHKKRYFLQSFTSPPPTTFEVVGHKKNIFRLSKQVLQLDLPHDFWDPAPPGLNEGVQECSKK